MLPEATTMLLLEPTAAVEINVAPPIPDCPSVMTLAAFPKAVARLNEVVPCRISTEPVNVFDACLQPYRSSLSYIVGSYC